METLKNQEDKILQEVEVEFEVESDTTVASGSPRQDVGH